MILNFDRLLSGVLMVHVSTIITGWSHYPAPAHVPLLRESVKQCQSIHRLNNWHGRVNPWWPDGITESPRSVQALTTCVGAVSTAWKAAWHKPTGFPPPGHSKTSESWTAFLALQKWWNNCISKQSMRFRTVLFVSTPPENLLNVQSPWIPASWLVLFWTNVMEWSLSQLHSQKTKL